MLTKSFQKIFKRCQYGLNISRFQMTAAAHQKVERHQPFTNIQIDQNLNIINNNPPVIEPKFWYEEPVHVLNPSKFTIDCSKFDKNTINKSNTDLVDEMREKFHNVGLVYLTNTNLHELQDMRQVISILIPREMEMQYKGGSNWRNYIEPNVYDTGAPASAWIHYHHEMTYLSKSPVALGFCCQKSCGPKGATYVSDGVANTEYILSTDLGQKLKEKGVCYHRNLTDELYYQTHNNSEEQVYNHWQRSFLTSDMDEAAEIAKERGLVIEWDLDHPLHGRYLKTKYYTDAFEYFPLLDKNLLYSSIADHWMWFDTWPGVCDLNNDDRPLKISYGDDTDLTEDDLKEFVYVYDKYGIPIPWNVGDIGIVCNYRWAHGRPIYHLDSNEKRELGVVLGQLFDRVGQKADKW